MEYCSPTDHPLCPRCKRIKDHLGVHTQYPTLIAIRWDFEMYERQVLAFLDFETPSWADLLDPV